MTIKKVTVEDLKNIRGGVGSADKVSKGEKKVIKQVDKEEGKDASKELAKKNDEKKGKPGIPVNSPNGI